MGSVAGGRGGGRQKKAQKGIRWFLLDEKVVPGGKGASALLVAYSASLMTLGKTVLYCESDIALDFYGHINSLT